MGGEVEMLRERISFLEEENDNLMIEKEIALTKMEQVILRVVPLRKLRIFCYYPLMNLRLSPRILPGIIIILAKLKFIK